MMLHREFLEALEKMGAKKRYDRAVIAALAAQEAMDGNITRGCDFKYDLEKFSGYIFDILTQEKSDDLESDMEWLDLYLGELETSLIGFILEHHANLLEALKE